MAKIDETTLVDRTLPKRWTCPHCGRRNRMDPNAEAILLEFFKVIRHCASCGYLHYWKLVLTEDFKQGVIEMISTGFYN